MATSFMKAINKGVTTLDGGITDEDLTITVIDSSVFPTTYPFPISINDEICSVTNNNTGTNILTITRAQESTAAAAADSGDTVENTWTAKYITDISTAVNALETNPVVHHDRHDPHDGADALDCAAPDTNVTPEAANAEGDTHTFARSDHMHYLPCAAASTIQPDDSAAEGTAESFSRSDHDHAIVAAAPGTNVTPEQANAEGSATSFARSDHMHNIPSGAPSELASVQAAAEGTGAAFARTDHAHQIQASIADNHLVTIDHATPVENDLAFFTASGLKGLSYAEALAALFSVALPENVSILLDPVLSADGKWSGICETGTAGTNLAFGDLAYFAVADSKWEKAFATAAATAFGQLGMVVVAGAEDAAITLLLLGKIRADAKFPTLTVGAPVYISKDTAGLITMTIPPKATNHVVRIIGKPKTANELWFSGGVDNFYAEYA